MVCLKVVCIENPVFAVGNGKYHDQSAIQDVISYCQNPQKTINHYCGGLAVNYHHAAQQMDDIALAYGKQHGVRLRHMVLSFSPDEQIHPLRVNWIGRQIAAYYSGRFQIIYAVHEDTENLHIHFVMNMVSYIDGKKYEGGRQDYYLFQQHVRKTLKDNGCLSLTVVKDTV